MVGFALLTPGSATPLGTSGVAVAGYAYATLSRAELAVLAQKGEIGRASRIEALAQRQLKLVGKGEVGGGGFGSSIGLSADGRTALIGGGLDDEGRGAVWAFRRISRGWVQQGRKFVARDELGKAGFGGVLALSADGKTAVIGGPGDSHRLGAAWIFVLRGSRWVQQGAKLRPTGEIGQAEFGYAVAISADGATALVGAPDDSRPKNYHYNDGYGAAWVFRRSGATWTQDADKLRGSGETSTGLFGGAVALAANGRTLLVGAPNAHDGRGAAWIFVRAASDWRQEGGQLRASHELGPLGEFGSATALSANGHVAFIGGPSDNTDVGAVWVFGRSGHVWKQQGPKLTARDERGRAGFGIQIAVAENGNAVLIGGWQDEHNRGAAWLFKRHGTVWAQTGTKVTGNNETGRSHFGIAAALSGDASTMIVGGFSDDHTRGAAWSFG